MHTIEEKHQFTLLRVQGWSIAKISAHMKIPKATIWRWDHDEREILPILKAARYEELQEKYVPTYEEELQQLSSYRERIRKALGDQDFSTMKPEFLLQMDLQISARLAKFRANLALHSVPEEKPISLPGCLSHTEVPYNGVHPYDDPRVEGEPDRTQPPAANPNVPVNGSPVNAAPAHSIPLDPGHSANSSSNNGHSSPTQNGTFRYETPPGSKRAASAPTTSDEKNGTVPFYKLLQGVVKELTSIANSGSTKGRPAPKKRNSTSGPATEPSNTRHSSSSQNGTFRDKTPPGSKRAASASTTSSVKNGTVPFSKNGKPTKSPPVPTPTATAQPTSNEAHKASHSANGAIEDPKTGNPQSVTPGHSSYDLVHSEPHSNIQHHVPGSSIEELESVTATDNEQLTTNH